MNVQKYFETWLPSLKTEKSLILFVENSTKLTPAQKDEMIELWISHHKTEETMMQEIHELLSELEDSSECPDCTDCDCELNEDSTEEE